MTGIELKKNQSQKQARADWEKKKGRRIKEVVKERVRKEWSRDQEEKEGKNRSRKDGTFERGKGSGKQGA